MECPEENCKRKTSNFVSFHEKNAIFTLLRGLRMKKNQQKTDKVKLLFLKLENEK